MCETISRRDIYITYVVKAERCFLKLYTIVLHTSIKRVIYSHGNQRTGTTRRLTTDELTFELISNLFFHLSAVI